jgi:hypothetical protein
MFILKTGILKIDIAPVKSSYKRERGPFDRISLHRNCVLSLDQNFNNQLTKFFDAFQLIEICNNDFSINCQNPSVLFSQLIESSNNGILSF